MQSANFQDQNIQHLIKANYQRMMAFEQAAFVCDESTLKTFFTARADESENNLRELCSFMNITTTEAENYVAQNNSTAEKIGELFTGKKNAVKILQSAKMLEKTILGWYKSAIKEIKSLPKEVVETVSSQYKALAAAELQLQYL